MKIYTMINRDNGVKVECSEKYLLQWMSRGFEILNIKYRDEHPTA